MGRYSKTSKKVVTFIAEINYLFYYDEGATKQIVVRDISTTHTSIKRKMNMPWFLVIGDKRSALFATDSISTRDKWVSVITQSLSKHDNFGNIVTNGSNDKLILS